MRSIHLLPFFFLLAISCGQETKVDEPVRKAPIKKKAVLTKPGLVYGTELVRSRKTPFEDGYGREGDSIYYTSFKGLIQSSDTITKKRKVLFDLKTEFMVDRIFLIPMDNGTYFLNWQETDHEGVQSNCALYEVGGKKPVWKRTWLVPDPGQPVRDGEHVYVSCLGVVAKINIRNGEYVWKHDSLFNPLNKRYQKFEPAIVREQQVIYVDYPVPGKRNYRDSIRFDPNSGDIVH